MALIIKKPAMPAFGNIVFRKPVLKSAASSCAEINGENQISGVEMDHV